MEDEVANPPSDEAVSELKLNLLQVINKQTKKKKGY